MGQAFDSRGNPLGDGVFGETKREVFDKLQNMHPDAHEYRIKSLKEQLDSEEARLGSVSTEMPRYRSHKDVWALKIASIDRDSDKAKAEGRETDGSAIITPAETGYAPFAVDWAYMRKHEPKVGGYYVVYKDGYKSFSPAEAFEDGYTKSS